MSRILTDATIYWSDKKNKRQTGDGEEAMPNVQQQFIGLPQPVGNFLAFTDTDGETIFLFRDDTIDTIAMHVQEVEDEEEAEDASTTPESPEERPSLTVVGDTDTDESPGSNEDS